MTHDSAPAHPWQYLTKELLSINNDKEVTVPKISDNHFVSSVLCVKWQRKFFQNIIMLL